MRFSHSKNVKSRFQTALGGLIFKAAKAADDNAFLDAMAEMRRMHRAATEYVWATDPMRWARAFFPSRRFGHVTSNMSESMNRWLEDVRRLDPVDLLSTYVLKVNILFERRRAKYAAMDATSLPKRVAESLHVSIEEGRKLRVYRHTESVFHVQRLNRPGTSRVVNLDTRTCSCGFYKEHGVPCRHICAAALSIRRHPKEFVIPQRRLAALRNTYVGYINPVDVSLLRNDGTKSPAKKRTPGRPREKRIPSRAENGPRRTTTCGCCGGRGHNSRSCKMK